MIGELNHRALGPVQPAVALNPEEESDIPYKQIGIGIGAGVLASWVGEGAVALSIEAGVLKNMDRPSVMKQMCVTILAGDGVISDICGILPVAEEIFFRYGIQEILLNRVSKKIIHVVAPGREKLLDSQVAKAARIILTASLFSYAHSLNTANYPDSYSHIQAVSTFITGLAAGILKESNIGLVGSIFSHIAGNALGLREVFSHC